LRSSRAGAEAWAAHPRALADDGADIIVTYRSNPEEANAVAAELSGRDRTAIALPLDVTDHDSFLAFAGELRGQLRERWTTEQFDILSRSLFTPEPAPRRSSSEPAGPTISPGA
jgi:NAD(P)-dependent dehydrogenase (short-subunit alcohol dehydrogenase family)